MSASVTCGHFCLEELMETSFRSPWQNAYAERLIGSIRRECIDHVVVFGERHLRHVLLSYKDYYNATRTHLSLNKDAPVPRGVEWEYRLPPDPGRTAPSIWPDMIYGRHSYVFRIPTHGRDYTPTANYRLVASRIARRHHSAGAPALLTPLPVRTENSIRRRRSRRTA